jgi:hypothetical protein
MHRSLSLRAVICLSTLLPASILYAAPDTDIETLKQELLELKQRYEVQQKALAVLEQRVRQVEDQPATPAPKAPGQIPADLRKGTTVAGAPGLALAQRQAVPVAAAPMGKASRMIRPPRRASATCTTRPAAFSAMASSASRPASPTPVTTRAS